MATKRSRPPRRSGVLTVVEPPAEDAFVATDNEILHDTADDQDDDAPIALGSQLAVAVNAKEYFAERDPDSQLAEAESPPATAQASATSPPVHDDREASSPDDELDAINDWDEEMCGEEAAGPAPEEAPKPGSAYITARAPRSHPRARATRPRARARFAWWLAAATAVVAVIAVVSAVGLGAGNSSGTNLAGKRFALGMTAVRPLLQSLRSATSTIDADLTKASTHSGHRARPPSRRSTRSRHRTHRTHARNAAQARPAASTNSAAITATYSTPATSSSTPNPNPTPTTAQTSGSSTAGAGTSSSHTGSAAAATRTKRPVLGAYGTLAPGSSKSG